jgi:hypothetical protein
MENEDLIAVEIFCSHHEIGISFIDELKASGLLQVERIQEQTFLPVTELQKLEQLVRMHYDLNINIEGLEVISHLLDRLQSLQSEITALKNRLRRFEQ